jgi:thiosulfate/3-mercaptopyruvate sulfurtransferase
MDNMSKVRVGVLGVLSLLLLLAPIQSQAQEWSPEQQEVLTALQELWHYSGALDFDPWFERVSEDYRGWGVTDDTPRGKAQWLEEAHGRLERPLRVHHQILPKAIDIHGEVAIIYYQYAALFRSAEGAFNLSKGQWTDTFRRDGSRWLLIADAGGETESHPDILVSSEWLDRRRGDPNLVILQVESSAERYTEGHIPGAVLIPYNTITWAGANEESTELLPLDEIAATLEELGVSDTDQIVVYSSHPLRATRLWFTLDVMGVGRTISLLDGGLAAWSEEGRPLSTEVPGPQPQGTLTLSPRPETVVDAEWVQANSEAPGIALVDARYQPEYTGEDQEGESVGHIPGAGNAVWEEMVQSREVFRFKSVEEMAANMAAAGADAGETVVPYCIVGLRASLDYYVARLLGFETLLYDGSFRDWTSRGLPLVEGAGGGNR